MKTTHLARTLPLLLLGGIATTHAALVVYDGFTPATNGSIDGQATGSGWANAWETQNDSAVFQATDASPLAFGGLTTTPGYLVGGGDWLGANHFISRGFQSGPDQAGWVSAPFSDQQIDQGTVWASFLVRRETNSGDSWRGPTQIGFMPSLDINSTGTTAGALFTLPAAGGNWTFRRGGADFGGGTAIDTGVAATIGQTQLFVLKYSFGATSTVRAWIFTDPTAAGLAGSDLADGSENASLSFLSINDVRFNNFGLYTGGVSNAVALDEVRIGTDYASVTPIPEPATAGLAAALASLLAFARRRR